MPDPHAPCVFLSHTSADTSWCKRFVRHLEDAGADVWWDKDDLRAGGLFQIINRELASRPFFIAILSPDAVKSEWVNSEMSAAFNLKQQHPNERFFLPVVMRKCEVPPLVGGVKYVAGKSDLTPRKAADEVILALDITPVRATTVSRSKPKTVEDAILRARSLVAQGRPQDALDMIEIALKMDGSSAVAWAGKGRALSDLRQLDEALEAFTRAIESDPNEALGWAGRGAIYGERREYSTALNDLDQALQLNPDFLAPLLNRATVFLHLNRLDSALADADSGVQIEPQYGPGLTTRGRALQALGRSDEALAAYEAALAAPDIAEAPTTTPADWRTLTLFHKAELLLSLHSPFAALAMCDQALQRDNSSYFAWKSKGDALWRLGRHQEALDAYEHALTYAPTTEEQASAWAAKGAALIGLGEAEDAKSAYMQALRLKPAWPEALRGLGDALRALGQRIEADDAYRRALTQGTLTTTNIAATLNSLAIIASDRGNMTEALDFIDQAIAAVPSDARYWLNKVSFLAMMNQPDAAMRVQLQLGQAVLAKAEEAARADPNIHAK